MPVTLPSAEHGTQWKVELGTGGTIDVGDVLEAGQTISRPAHSLLILLRPPLQEEQGEDAAVLRENREDQGEIRPIRA